MRTSAFEPPDIPATFWEHPSVARALAERDMGALFWLINHHTGISQIRIGTAVGLGQGRISDVIHRKREIKEKHVFERIADGLKMPDHARLMMGLGTRQVSSSPSQAKGASLRAGQHTELLYRISASRHVDAEVIAALQNETNSIRLLDRRLGAPAVSAKLQAHIDYVDNCLRYSLRPGQRQALASVLAEASSLAGWQAIDAGKLPAAWEHYERATAAAREADDKSLLAYAAGEQAYVLADLGENEDALTVVRAAHDETRTAIPHQIKAWLYAAEGEMAAAAGQETACRRALDLAAKEIEHGPSGQDLPYLALNAVHLARWRGNCLVTFGDIEVADELTRALDAMDDSFTRAEAGVRCDLAAALHVRGDRDEAQRHLRRARELAQLTDSARQRRRVRQLSRRLSGRAA
jgi:tetratricopeptide (TPR) repeat protein